ncbi:MAG: hypothetical protein RR280_08515 [Bacteroidaceae bacterium]
MNAPVTAEKVLVDLIGRERADVIFQQALGIADQKQRDIWLHNLIKYVAGVDTQFIDDLHYIRRPVDPITFLYDENYLGKKGEIYAEVEVAYLELNSGDYDEAVMTGGIGSAKTSLALYSQAYQLYLLSCLRNPQLTYGLDKATEILMVFQSLNEDTAADVDYQRFYNLISASPYFQEVFPYDKGVKSFLRFPHNIECLPVGAGDTATIGRNVIGGIIDEINFMKIKEKDDGTIHNQAVELYNTVARRRKSRFMQGGKMAGLLCVVSSKKLPDEFTDKKMEEAKRNPRIYVYDKRVWDVKPDSFGKERFRIHIGTEAMRPRILKEGEIVREEDQQFIDLIPMEFYDEFVEDIVKAVRDIAGHTTLATVPFMSNAKKVVAAFSERKNLAVTPRVDFVETKLQLLTNLCKVNPQFFRFAHIDLAVTGDSAGLAIGHVPQFIQVDESGLMMPYIQYDLVLEIAPPTGGEIEFAKIRKVLIALKELGMPIKWVTLDSYQSRDTMQILRQKGFMTGLQSMDTSLMPYDTLKTAIYDERVDIPAHETAKKELLALEINYKKGKVDHNDLNTKDVSDALAGVAYGLTNRREVWAQHKVPINEFIVNKKETLKDKTNTDERADAPDIVLAR